MATMKASLKNKDEVRKENAAQWQSLSDLAEKTKKNEIEVIVNQRLFQMLLDQNGIDIRIKREVEEPRRQPEEARHDGDEGEDEGDLEVVEERKDNLEKETNELYEELPRASRKDRIDAFKEEQIRQFTREQLQRQFKK